MLLGCCFFQFICGFFGLSVCLLLVLFIFYLHFIYILFYFILFYFILFHFILFHFIFLGFFVVVVLLKFFRVLFVGWQCVSLFLFGFSLKTTKTNKQNHNGPSHHQTN